MAADKAAGLWQHDAVTSRKAAFRRTFAASSVRRSVMVALLVGTTLNAINQGPELLRGATPIFWKIALTYIVPFLVASYGSYAAFRSAER
jgi:hypothetical protein